MNELAGLLQQWVGGKTQKPTSEVHSTDNRKDRKRKREMSGDKELTDPHIVLLSKNITSENELVELCVTGLKLKYTNIKTALTNHPGDITSAARDVLRTWLQGQTDRTEALTNLLAALEACGMNLLAAELKQFSAGPETGSKMSKERIQYLQQLNKESLRSKPFCLARGKDWTVRPSMTDDFREIFTDLSWSEKHRKMQGTQRKKLENITQILNKEQLGEDGPVRILVQAGGGMGKSTAMKHLALSWADGTVDELKDKFQFVFHIALKQVRDNSPIENIIIAQHNRLKANKVEPAEIRSILEGDSKVLLIVDGHDEYKTGRNTDIDDAIKKESLGSCWLILTSRETEQIKDLKQYMDAELDIHGFDSENIEKYITRYFENDQEKTCQLLKQAKERNIYWQRPNPEIFPYRGILTIPFLLQMICVLFKTNATNVLPRTKSGIMQAIIDRCMDREAIRAMGQKAIASAEQALYNLGKLAWQGLNEPGKKLIFEKEEVIRLAGKEALGLGLLFGTEKMSVQEEETDVLCFAHLQFQEFVAAIYISQQTKAEIKKLFPTWESIEQHKEVIRFACAIAENPDVLIEVICDTVATDITTKDPLIIKDFIMMRLEDPCDLLESIKQELVEKTHSSMDPLKNSHVYLHKEGESTSNLVLSRVYVLERMQRGILYQYPGSGSSSSSTDNPVKYALVAGDHEACANSVRFVKVLHEQHKIHISDVNIPCIRLGKDNSQSDSGDSLSEEYYLLLSDTNRTNNQRNRLELDLLRVINSFQKVSINSLSMFCISLSDEDVSKLMDVLYLSGNIKSLTIDKCHLPASVYQHIAQQLYRCHKSDKSKYGERKMSTEGAGEEVGCSTIETLKLERIEEAEYMMRNLIQAERLTRLRELDLSRSPVTDYLGDLLGAGFPSLEKLNLQATKLSETDLSNLAKVIRGEGLLRLKKLNLIDNSVKDCLEDLLSAGLPSLEELYLENTKLSKPDLSKIAEVVRDKALFKVLLLWRITLTDCLGDLLDAGLPTLEELYLYDTELSKADVSKLTKVVRDRSSLKVKKLSLSHNTLTGCLGDLLGVYQQPGCPGQLHNDPQHPGFPYLELLDLSHTSLSRDDLLALSTAVQGGRLPRLEELNVRSNSLGEEGEAVERLVQSCVDYYTESGVRLGMDNYGFYGRMKSLCYNSKVIF